MSLIKAFLCPNGLLKRRVLFLCAFSRPFSKVCHRKRTLRGPFFVEHAPTDHQGIFYTTLGGGPASRADMDRGSQQQVFEEELDENYEPTAEGWVEFSRRQAGSCACSQG
jgi:hypothetical protein